MAKESSFDVVSEVDLQEVDNAVNQASKEIAQRYDLKGTGSSVCFDRGSGALVITANAEFVAQQVKDVLQGKLVKRGIDLKSVAWGAIAPAAGATVRCAGTLVQGIDQEISRTINKDVKTGKFKVKVQIEGDKLRVSSPSRDALQEVIAFLREKDYGVPLQFNNYR